MYRTQSIELPKGVRAYRINMGRTLAVLVTFQLTLMMTVSLVFGVAVRAGIVPAFDQPIVLAAQHRLVIHNGPSPTCAFIPNPPQHDCFRPGPEQREFSVVYLTPDGARSLVWFRLPAR